MATEPRRQGHRVDVPLLILTLASVCPFTFGSGESVELKRSGDSVEVLVGGRTFTTYYFSAAVAKPYYRGPGSRRLTSSHRGIAAPLELRGSQ